MSGGSLDYFYSRVEELAGQLSDKDRPPIYRAFSEHLYKVAKALHDIEWVLSGDYSEGDEEAAILEVIGNGEYKVLKSDAEELIKRLEIYRSML